MRRVDRRLFAALLGATSALVVAEVGLRVIATPYDDSWHHASIAADLDAGPLTTIREYHEGIATSHFTGGHSRVTGNPFNRDAPADVVLGDSYVQAIQVGDQSTIGAVIERLSLAAGEPRNVRQYGWSAASAAAYIAVAPAVLHRWQPRHVVVLLNDTDLGAASLSDWPTSTVSLDTVLRPTGPLTFEDPPGFRGDIERFLKPVARHSSLVWETLQRTAVIRQPVRAARRRAAPAPTALDSLVPIAAVRGLARAYGERLLIVFVGVVPPFVQPENPLEPLLMSACRAEAVRCVSATPAMVDARDRAQRLARGFVNSAPGVGHLNAFGHALVGRLVWDAVAADRTGSPIAPPASR